MNRRFLILMSSLLTGTILSAQANPFKDMEELDKFLPKVKEFKSIPSPRTFHSDPARTAAGVLHYAIDSIQGPVILLGLRDDEETYCNLGGKSDDEEGQSAKVQEKLENISATLAQTASREVEEESNGYYAHHPYDLQGQPFIDTLTKRAKKESLLYRMYWKKVQKVDGDILFKALEEGQQDQNKEYKGFKWVPVEKVLSSLKKRKSTIKLGKGEKIELFQPLFQTLSTGSGFAFLESIISEGKISRFNSNLRPFQNRLYLISNDEDELNEGDYSSDEKEKSDDLPSKKGELEHADFKVRWELPNSSPTPGKTKDVILNPGQEKVKKITFHKGPFVPLGQNAWGEKKQILKLDGLSESFEVPLLAEKDRKDFAYAVASHGAAMVELKHKADEIRRKAKIEEDKEEPISLEGEEGWNPNSDLSLSRIHLRMVLGEGFNTAENFPEADSPQRAADIENLRAYLTTHKDVEYAQKGVRAEFKRQINFTESDLEVFADYLEWEGQTKKNPPFAHGANADMNNLWITFTHLREFIDLIPLLGEKMAMRGTDIYYRTIKTMTDILKSYGYDDYAAGKAAVVLCANYVLTAGLNTTRTSSSSIEYFLNNHSVAAPEVEEKFEEATALAGIIGHYPYFRSPFLQYLAHRHPTFENSVLIGISVPPHLLADHTYAAHGGGRPFTKWTEQPTVAVDDVVKVREDKGETHTETPEPFEESKEESTLNVIDVFKGIQDEYTAHKETPEPFDVRKEEKRDLIPEARISLHPDLAFHKDVKMKAFNRFPLSEPEQKDFESEMRTATIGTLADWLSSHFKVMPDSFVEYPALKRLYHYAYKAITGEKVEEKFAFESFIHLVSNGHLNGVKEFVKAFPEITDHKDFNPLDLAYTTLRTNKPEMLKYLCEELFKKSPKDIFETTVGFHKAIRICLRNEATECLDYLLSFYDVKEVPNSLVQIWFRYLDGCDSPELFKVFLKHFPPHQSHILRFIFKNNVTEDFLDKLIAGGVNPRLIVEQLNTDAHGKKSILNLSAILAMIAKHKVDLRHFEVIRSKLFRPLFKGAISEDQLETLITSGVRPELLVEELITVLGRKKSNYNWYPLLKMLAAHKVDLRSLHTQTNLPLGEELLQSNILGPLFEQRISEDCLDTLITSGVSPQAFLERLMIARRGTKSPRDHFDILKVLARHKVDLTIPHTRTNLPLGVELLRSNVLGPLFEEHISPERIDMLVTCGMSPQTLLEGWVTVLRNRRSHGGVAEVFDMLDIHKVDLSMPHPKTGSPLIFELIALNPISVSNEFSKYFYEQLPSLTHLRDVKGKTIFDYAQMAFERKKKNALLYLVNPYTLWIGSKFYSNDSWNWYYKFAMAHHLKNREEMNQLMQNLPVYIDGSHVTFQSLFENENDFKEIVQELRKKIAEQTEVLERARTALKRHDFQAFYQIFKSSEQSKQVLREGIQCVEIETFCEFLTSDILDENESENMTKGAKKEKKKEKEKEISYVPSYELKQFLDLVRPLIPVTETICEKDFEEILKVSNIINSEQCDVEYLKSQLLSLKNPQLLRYIFAEILRLDNHQLTLETLKQAFPNVEEFISLEKTYECNNNNASILCHPICVTSIGNLQESALAIIEYLGDRFHDLAITIEERYFGDILEKLSDEMARSLVKRYPSIFTYKDEEKDFFNVSMGALPPNVLREFALEHKEKLRDIQLFNGSPYFFSLFDKENEALIFELVKSDPSLLEIESVDGLTAEDFLGDVLGQKNTLAYKKMMRKLKS